MAVYQNEVMTKVSKEKCLRKDPIIATRSKNKRPFYENEVAKKRVSTSRPFYENEVEKKKSV